MSAASSGMRRIPALDGLRGIAIVGVLAFHAGLLRGGYLGVDLFFVLSGFLITSLLIAEQARSGRIRLATFWARRARRLLPAMLLMLAGVAAYAAWLAEPEELGRIRADAIASILYVANWRNIEVGNDYWSLFRAPSPLQHMWSLAIEEQFYIVWPVVVAAVLRLLQGRTRPLAALALVAAACAAAWGVALASPSTSAARLYMGTDTRSPALFLGALVAASTAHGFPRGRGRTALGIGGAVALAVLALAWARLDGGSPVLHRGGLALVSVAAAVLIAAASDPEAGTLARLLSLRPLRWLGGISYALYLWHWPVHVAMTEARTGLDGPALLAAKLVVDLALAIASSYAVERPIREGSFPGWRMAPIAAGAFAGVTGLVLVATAGAVDRPPPGRGADEPSPAAATHAGAPPGRLRLLVVGDSVGFYLGAALANDAPELQLEVTNRAIVACGLSRGSGRVRVADGTVRVRGTCEDWETAWARDVAEVEPDVALLVLAGPTQGDLEIEGRWVHPCEPAFDAVYRREAARAIDVLGSRGAAVVFTSVPYVDANEEHAENRQRTDCVNADYAAAVATSGFAEIVDLGRYLCPSLECRTHEGGARLRPDGAHIEGPGARPVARWLASALRELPLAELRTVSARARTRRGPD